MSMTGFLSLVALVTLVAIAVAVMSWSSLLQHAGHRIGLWQQVLPSSLRWLGANVPGFR